MHKIDKIPGDLLTAAVTIAAPASGSFTKAPEIGILNRV